MLARRVPLIVGGGRQLARLDECADHAAFEKDRQAGTAQPLRQRGGQKRDTDAREYHLSVLELTSAQDGEQLGGVALRLSIINASPARAASSSSSVPIMARKSFHDFGP